jgi:cation diffusion facilitator CzcD-associated flavoprotein CzcO
MRDQADGLAGRITQMGLKNKDGLDIKDVWKDGIRTYLGMTINGFPNCFMVYTPHGKSLSSPNIANCVDISVDSVSMF